MKTPIKKSKCIKIVEAAIEDADIGYLSAVKCVKAARPHSQKGGCIYKCPLSLIACYNPKDLPKAKKFINKIAVPADFSDIHKLQLKLRDYVYKKDI
jgi:hypothetical protein